VRRHRGGDRDGQHHAGQRPPDLKGADAVHTQLIANLEAWEDPWKREKIEQIALLLQGALRAENMVGLKMNVPEDKVREVMEILPSLNSPTVSHLYQSNWLAVEVVVSKGQVRDLIPNLLKRGAEGIIEYPLYKVI